MSERTPLEEARLWLTMYRELGIEEIRQLPVAEAQPAEPAASQPSTPAHAAAVPATSASAKPKSVNLEMFESEHAAEIKKVIEAKGTTAERLEQLRTEVIGDCTRCRLGATRTNLVFGVGNPEADLMFVGEGPGADEDRLGEPFVGRAGKLLDKIIVAMGLSREQVYIANVVKCRPPENRNPLPDESATCLPFLMGQIAIIRPRVIVTLGKTALEGLIGEKIPSITRARGQWFEVLGVPVKATFHPAYLLRSPSQKRPVWEDMQDVMKRLDLPSS